VLAHRILVHRTALLVESFFSRLFITRRSSRTLSSMEDLAERLDAIDAKLAQIKDYL
jgi:HAMP domain-containing protein